MRQVRVEDQQQCGTFLNDANPRVLVAVEAALVPFGLFKPALQIKIVWRQVCLFAPHKQSGSKARHDTTHMLPDGIVARLELLLSDLKLRLTLGTCATVWVECRLDRSHILHGGSNRLLGVMDCRQTSRHVAC